MSVIGIDIGDQNCYVAVARQGGIETVINDYSQRATPSCVAFGPNNRIMGVAARQQLLTNLKNTIWGFKCLIGRKFRDPVVQKEMPSLPYEIVEMPDHNVGVKVVCSGKTEIFSIIQIMGMLFLKLKEVSESYLQTTKVTDCVISVPCFWTDCQRRAILDAAQIVGLNPLRLMNETTAVALNYGIYRSKDLPEENEKPRVVVFIDSGYSSTQVYAVAFHKQKLKVLGCVYDANLGGRDFDSKLRDHFTKEFKDNFKVNASESARPFLRLADECEKLKKQMSANATVIPLNIECFLQEKDVRGAMKRADFEALCTDLWDRMENLMKQLLSETKLKTGDIFAVEMVGGTTRIPMIRQLALNVFGIETSTTLNQDEAVVKGCALQCAILSPAFVVKEFGITDIQLFSIKLSWSADKGEDGETEVFPENHPVPFSKMLTFYRKEPFWLEGSYTYPNHIPYPTTFIGRFKVNGVRPTSDEESSKVKVKVRINSNGIFTISSASMYEKSAGPTIAEVEDPMETESQSNDSQAQANGPVPPTPEQMDTDKLTTDANSVPDNQQSEATAGDAEMKDAVKPPQPVKQKVKSIDLPIEQDVPQLSKLDLQKLCEIEWKLQAQDRAEKEKNDAKNSLEEYTYFMREKLSDSFQPFITPKDCEKFVSMLSDTENWLYEEGEDQPKQVYCDRLAELKKIGDPVAERFDEAQDRPKQFDDLGAALIKTRKAYEAYLAKDEKYDHLEAKDMEKVRKALDEKQSWLETQLSAQQRRPLTEPPVVLAMQIKQEREAFERVVNPILSRPKPKKEPPPAPAAQKSAEAEMGQEGNGANGKTNQTGTKPNGESKPEGTMDVD